MRLLRLLCCAAALAPWVPAQPSGLTLEQKESFLRSAKITKFRPIATGITGSHRATLDDGTLQHDAHIQSIDEFKAKFDTPEGTELNFRDSYKFNIAAYELAKLLDLADMVPPSVQRRVEGFTSAVTWWVDDVLMDEAARMKKQVTPPDLETWNRQMEVVRVFDQLIYNTDRNLRNLLITKEWRLFMIDHTRAFRRLRELRNEANLTRCDRKLLERMAALNKADLNKRLKPFVTGPEIDGLLARRDKIVRHFKEAARKSGDEAIFFDRPR